jgi:tetratricopeptide (TPR) repeat protein
VGLANADEAKYQDAIQEYSAAVQLNPNFEGVYYRMGLAQAKLKNYDDAITAFHKEQENSADDYFIETALADAYRAKGMTKEADDATRKAAQLKSQR